MRPLCRIAGVILASMLVLGAVADARASDGETLAQITERGVLRCGVGESLAGFASHNAAGTWSGMDIDFCRALSASVLGSPDRVVFVPVRAAEGFPALEEDMIDVLVRNTSWTLQREGSLGVQFAGILYYDTQALMLRASARAATSADLKGAAICMEEGTSSLDHLHAWSAANGLELRPMVFASAAEARDALFAGRCRAWASDASQLAVARQAAPGGRQAWAVLDAGIADEPLGPVVRNGDASWLVLVRWVLIALLSAEQLGLTRDNLAQRAREAAVQAALVPDSDVDRTLGVAPGWMLRAVAAVGNYSEMFDRNLGARSPLNIERGRNRLWTQGGLMYAPPIR